MKKWITLAAFAAISFASVSSQATANCAHGQKSSLFAKRDWSALKAGSTAKAEVKKAVATKSTDKKAVR